VYRGPAQTPHARAGTRYPPTQAGWQAHKRRQGTRRQVQRARTQEGYALQAPWPGEIQPTRMVGDGQNECSVGIRLRLVTEELWLFSNLPGAYPVSVPPGCRTCRLVPSSINYASQKWSRQAHTDAPERAAACPSTMSRGTVVQRMYR